MIDKWLIEDTSWWSWIGPLTACLAASTGPVLEVGMGEYSTPWLHLYCAGTGRELVSLDDDPEWVVQFKQFEVCCHTIASMSKLDGYARLNHHWGVVFIDHSEAWRRAETALLFRDTADFIVVHDYSGTEDGKPSVAETFAPIHYKWRNAVVSQFSPSSLVLSNRDMPEIPKARWL